MTKEVDFLSLSKSAEVKTDTKTNSKVEKKEGLSLFDSLIIKNQKKETSEELTDTKTKTDIKVEKKEKTTELLQKEQNITKSSEKGSEEKTSDIKSEKKESTNLNTNLKKIEKLQTKENTSSVKVSSFVSELKETETTESETKGTELKIAKTTLSSSVLDRMIIEAKKNVKTLDIEKIVSVPKETKEPSNISSENKLNEDTAKTSLLDKMISKAKIVISQDLEKESVVDKTVEKTKKNSETKTSGTSELKKEKNEIFNKETNIKGLSTKETISATIIDTKIEVKDKNIKEVSKVNTKDINLKEEIKSISVTDTKVELKDKNQKLEKLSTLLDKNTKEVSQTNTKEVSLKEELKTATVTHLNEDTKQINEIVSESKGKEQKTDNKIEKVVLESKANIEKVEIKNNINTDEKIIKKDNNSKTEEKSTLTNEVLKPLVNSTNIEEKIIAKVDNSKTEEKSTLTNEVLKPLVNSTNIEEKIIAKVDNNKTEEKNVNLKESIDIKDPKKVNTSSSEELKSERISPKVSIDNTIKNLSKISPEAIVEDDQRVNIDKKNLMKESTSSNNKSLMDRLFDNAKNNTISSKESISNQPLEEQTNNLKTNDIVTNIFLSNRKNSIYSQMLSTKKEGTKVVKEGTNIDDVKKGAEILDLGLKKTSVNIEVSNNNPKVNNKFDNDALLDKLAFSKNIKKEDMLASTSSSSVSASVSSSSSAVTSNMESAVNINVNPSLSMTIQNRIIGAQQHMSSMMSDVARNMYENYKAPVTAFRINLFPSQLGHIAILMKNDRENGISISMNMSSANTLDSFVENQNILKEALNRNFNNNQTTFELDFNLQDQNPNFNQKDEQEKSEQNAGTHSSHEILETVTENQDVGEDLNYL